MDHAPRLPPKFGHVRQSLYDQKQGAQTSEQQSSRPPHAALHSNGQIATKATDYQPQSRLHDETDRQKARNLPSYQPPECAAR